MSSDDRGLTDKALDKVFTRIAGFFDPGSFTELSGAFAAGVVTGYGLLDGRLVFAYSQYGSVNLNHAVKIRGMYDKAMAMGAPVVAILDSPGIELANGMETLNAYGRIYAAMAECSGIVPQIAVVTGGCMGSAAFIPALSDFVIMCDNPGANLGLTSPNTLSDSAAKTLTMQEFCGAKVNAEKYGLADFTANDEEAALLTVKALLGYIPSNNLDEAPSSIINDEPDRITEGFEKGLQTSEGISGLISAIADNDNFLETGRSAGKSMITAFMRLNGYSVGVIANNGKLTPQGAEKAARFTVFCDAFSIPLLTLTGAAGYDFPASFHGYMVRGAARMAAAFAQATSPKVNVICGIAHGSSHIVMNSKPLGADITYVWDTVCASVLPMDGAKAVMGLESLEGTPEFSAQGGFVDGVIPAAATRKAVIQAFDMLNSKRVQKRPKKHSGMMM